MNKIFKVIYSKTRHCYVVVSEVAKSHCKTAGSHTARSKTALTAAVLLALGTFSVASVFMPMTAEAANSMSIAKGDNTRADGIASTVVGPYSGVINQDGNGGDFCGATALSYGAFNINQNTDPTKEYSGVANSIIGQANATTNSNAAIIYGAGNTVTNSYRDIDDSKFDQNKIDKIIKEIAKKDAVAVAEDLREAVPTSGGQVMVMGGGNVVDNAYMSQVTGVGNTVKGNQVYTKDAKTGKWNWTTDTNKETAIKDYNPEKSSQYNYIDGFSNEVINGKHDYVIGANNKLSGDSYDQDKPIKRSNRSNIVIGDNHTLTREQNTVIIGSIDTKDENDNSLDTQTKARDAVIIGHNANATNGKGADNGDNAVAIGRSAKATGGNAVTIGVNTSAGTESITIGSESSADSGRNIAIGRSAQVYGYEVTSAVALGENAKAFFSDGVAIGHKARANVNGGVALGAGSISSIGSGVPGYDPFTGDYSKDTSCIWKSTAAAVSVGRAEEKDKTTGNVTAITRQITNVAAGAKETDAVNVAQLQAAMNLPVHIYSGGNITNGSYNTGSLITPEMTISTLQFDFGDGLKAQEVGNEGDKRVLVTLDKDALKNDPDFKGPKGDKGEKGDQGFPGEHGEKGPKGDKGDKGEKGDTGAPGKAGKDGGVGTVVGDEMNIIVANTETDPAKPANYKVSLKKEITVDKVTARNTTISNDGLTITGGPSVTQSGINAGDKKITNVEDGIISKDSKDAINGSQLYNETRVAKDGNFVKQANTAGENLSALDNQVTANTESIYHMNGRISDLDNRVNKVGAGAAALAALHPLDFDPDDKWDFAVGYGNYRNANSVAFGAFYRPNEDTMFSLGTNFGNGENMFNAGLSFKIGQGSGITASKTAMAKKIESLEDTVDKQDKKIAELEALVKEQGEMIRQYVGKK